MITPGQFRSSRIVSKWTQDYSSTRNGANWFRQSKFICSKNKRLLNVEKRQSQIVLEVPKHRAILRDHAKQDPIHWVGTGKGIGIGAIRRGSTRKGQMQKIWRRAKSAAWMKEHPLRITTQSSNRNAWPGFYSHRKAKINLQATSQSNKKRRQSLEKLMNPETQYARNKAKPIHPIQAGNN